MVREPEPSRVVLRKAAEYLRLGRWVDAERALEPLIRCAVPATGPGALIETGTLLAHMERHEAALNCFSQAVRHETVSEIALFGLAACQRMCGRLEEAELTARALISRFGPRVSTLTLLSSLRRATPSDNSLPLLRAAIESERDPAARAAAGFALGKELDELDQINSAFDAWASAASLQKLQPIVRPPQAEIEQLAKICATVDAAKLSRVPAGPDSVQPIFICGLPRSGTTLVEQIVIGAGGMTSMGELNEFEMAVSKSLDSRSPIGVNAERAGECYRASLAAKFGSAHRFTDKAPLNFRFAGLIARALPGAKIVMIRRHPLDSALGMFSTNFSGLYPYSLDLRWLAEYLVGFRQLVEHWQRVLPTERVCVVDYEELVADPERESKRLFAFLNLPWSPSVLDLASGRTPVSSASAVQVRRAITAASVGKWRRYERQLGPVIAHLATRGEWPRDAMPRA